MPESSLEPCSRFADSERAMSRIPTGKTRRSRRHLAGALALGLSVATGCLLLVGPAGATTASVQAHAGPAAAPSWCSDHSSQLSGWTGTTPDLPICGPGPSYGGSWSNVDLPGPGGSFAQYYNATPGFQCVELAERWLALGEDLAPVPANGDQVAASYHAAYPRSLLVRSGTAAAVGHAPVAGDVISFSTSPSFEDPSDGHVAVVVASHVQSSTGDGRVFLAQQNVSSNDYRMVLDLVDWRLVDPSEPADAEFEYPYAEWFHLLPSSRASLLARQRAAVAARRHGGGPRVVAGSALLAPSERSLLAVLAPVEALGRAGVREASAALARQPEAVRAHLLGLLGRAGHARP